MARATACLESWVVSPSGDGCGSLSWCHRTGDGAGCGWALGRAVPQGLVLWAFSSLQVHSTCPAICLPSASLVPPSGGKAAMALLILCVYEVQSNGHHKNIHVLALRMLVKGSAYDLTRPMGRALQLYSLPWIDECKFNTGQQRQWQSIFFPPGWTCVWYSSNLMIQQRITGDQEHPQGQQGLYSASWELCRSDELLEQQRNW